jgi:hypothetical protein
MRNGSFPWGLATYWMYRIAISKAAFNNTKKAFQEQIGLKFKEETSKVLTFGVYLCMALELRYFEK